ncbi:MAG: pilus assembly protein [Phycisphaerales bacterium]|nr:pilus assembly protein [Phycisphaerales bacterium]
MVPLIMAGDPNWLPQALASRLSLYTLAWLLLLIPLTAVLVKLVLQLASQRRQAGRGREHQLHQNERGTAMIEFALVLPILLFMMLLLAQVTLLAAGNLHVHYAGYTATRTAIVQIPLDQSASGGSGPNVIRTSENDSKFSMIQRAGALACLPISGRESGGDVDAQPLLQGFAGLIFPA